MSRTFSKRTGIFAAISLALCLLVSAIGCTSGVSKEDYDQLKSNLAQATAELNQAKEQLVTAKQEMETAQKALQLVQSSWQGLEPEAKIAALGIEDARNYTLWQAGEITKEEYIARWNIIRPKMETYLRETGNEQLTKKFSELMNASGADRSRLYIEYNDLYISVTRKAMDDLSQKLSR